MKDRNLIQCMLGTTIFFILISIGAAIFTGIAYSRTNFVLSTQHYISSGEIQNFPSKHLLDGAGLPMFMTLPADLSEFVSKNEYSICSSTAQPHTVTIDTDAFNQAMWNDGVVQGTVVTFGGAVGDCVFFTIVSPKLISVYSKINVNIS